jgi:ABC-2 type transport system ATP-binding protein
MAKIDARGVSMSYGDVEALKDFSVEVGDGELVGLIGPNGAGKSSAIKILSGQIQRDSGDVEVLGIDPGERPKELRSRIGVLPEREDPPSFLTVEEYFDYVSEIRGEQIDREQWVERLNLEGKLGELTVDLSKGERQKLMIVQAFFHSPELVLIDEPLINLDPVVQEEVKRIFEEHIDSGGSLLLSTHVISLAEEVCDRVYLLEDGESRETGDTENLLEEF